MKSLAVRRARRADAKGLLRLVEALARFEKLEPPKAEAKSRLLADIFNHRRLGAFVAVTRGECVGYALYYYSYSSFLALPTLYLEDIFVRKELRGKGIGRALFRRCASEAMRRGCGRMELSVLEWNVGAARFYEDLGASRLAEWRTYRLDGGGIRAAAVSTASRETVPGHPSAEV